MNCSVKDQGSWKRTRTRVRMGGALGPAGQRTAWITFPGSRLPEETQKPVILGFRPLLASLSPIAILAWRLRPMHLADKESQTQRNSWEGE